MRIVLTEPQVNNAAHEMSQGPCAEVPAERSRSRRGAGEEHGDTGIAAANCRGLGRRYSKARDQRRKICVTPPKARDTVQINGSIGPEVACVTVCT